jgi:Na+/H+-dicarboxylate symporter
MDRETGRAQVHYEAMAALLIQTVVVRNRFSETTPRVTRRVVRAIAYAVIVSAAALIIGYLAGAVIAPASSAKTHNQDLVSCTDSAQGLGAIGMVSSTGDNASCASATEVAANATNGDELPSDGGEVPAVVLNAVAEGLSVSH